MVTDARQLARITYLQGRLHEVRSLTEFVAYLLVKDDPPDAHGVAAELHRLLEEHRLLCLEKLQDLMPDEEGCTR